MDIKQFHFIKYKNAFLGTPKKLLTFITPQQANLARSALKYERFKVAQKSANKYTLMHPKKLLKPLNRKELKIETMEPNTACYFAKVNNVSLELINEVVLNPEGGLQFVSDFKYADDLGFMDEWLIANHVWSLGEDPLDYEFEYHNFLLAEYMAHFGGEDGDFEE